MTHETEIEIEVVELELNMIDREGKPHKLLLDKSAQKMVLSIIESSLGGIQFQPED